MLRISMLRVLHLIVTSMHALVITIAAWMHRLSRILAVLNAVK